MRDACLSSRTFLRLWAIGGCVNTMRWFEVLCAALFTLDATGSGLAVAVVSAARTLPMLLLGAFAGVMSEAVDRKRILLVGQIMAGTGSATIAVLAAFGVAQPWHVGVAALLAGTVWSTEMSTRRRMVGECVEGALVPRALAFDTVTNSITRLIGPIAGGAAYQVLGLAGAYAISVCVYAVAIILVRGLDYRQAGRRMVLSQVPRDLAEAFTFARGHVIIGGVLAVTIAMNLLGFCYYALVAPIARQVFMVSPTLTGMLAGAEAFGALLGGLWLTGGGPRLSGRTLMVGGSLLFLVCVIADAVRADLPAGVPAAGHRRRRLGGVRQHADLADRAACAAAYPLAADGAADGLHRHRPAGHPADRRAGRPVRPDAGRGDHGDRPASSQWRQAASRGGATICGRPQRIGRHWPRKD